MKVGDILEGTSCYGGGFAHFYKVIKVSPSGKTVQLVGIRGDHKNPAPGRETSTPSNTYDLKDVITKRISHKENGEEYIYFKNGLFLHPWNGKPVSINTYD